MDEPSVFIIGENSKREENHRPAASKSRVRLLQSIGRGIRKHSEKEYCTFHDFADDMRTSKRTNYAWKHYANRIEVYETEGFDYSVSRIQIPDGS